MGWWQKTKLLTQALHPAVDAQLIPSSSWPLMSSTVEKSTWDPTLETEEHLGPHTLETVIDPLLVAPGGIALAHMGEQQGVIVRGLDKPWQSLHKILDLGAQQAAGLCSQWVSQGMCASVPCSKALLTASLAASVRCGTGSVCPGALLERTLSSSSALRAVNLRWSRSLTCGARRHQLPAIAFH